ncbi:autotransporter adhesin family protein [Treponema sp. TIM-1]|uniref:hypothetical protein n=1 Tax=Treponema sp. TIM-1 TaxID=2898417 RepID=UPI00398139F3
MRNHNPRVCLFPAFLVILWVAVVLMGGCALPLGEDYTIERSDNDTGLVIGNYDLQVYVPVPVAGAVPVTALSRGDLDLQAVWKDAGGNDISGSLTTFTAGEVYQADITISAKNGWSFDPGLNFQYPAGSVTTQPGPNSDPSRRTLTTISYRAAEAAKTIDQIDLSAYIPVPALGGTPVISFAGVQYTGTVEWAGDSGPNPIDLFQGGVRYMATVSLAARPGYVFGADPGFYHTGDTLSPDPAALACTIHPGNSGGSLSIEFPPTLTGTSITPPIDLTGLIPAPYTGGTPIRTFVSPGLEYSGKVSWTDGSGTPMTSGEVFQYGVIYQAKAVLTAAPGFVFPAGLTDTDFRYDGLSPVSYIPDGGGVGVRVSFGPADNWTIVSNYKLEDYIPLPVVGEMPTWTVDKTGVTGTISWDYYTPQGYRAVSPLEVFHNGVYRATISLQAKNGYKFNSTPFAYSDGTSVEDRSGTEIRSITVVYEELIGYFAQKPPANPRESNALERIQAAKNEFTIAAAPLYIDLSPGEEAVSFTANSLGTEGAVLDSSNSPDFVRIDGRGRKIRLTGNGGKAVITVKKGVTLYLRDITLVGIGNNTAALITVNGGTLVLEHGAVVEGNTNTNTVEYSAGGIQVINGGSLYIVGANAAIKNNRADGGTSGGGVYNSGTVIMEAGEISGNITSYVGGGVYNHMGGNFTMKGGKISGNTAARGGGVYQPDGTFRKTGGIIYGDSNATHTPGSTENTATTLSGHAVYLPSSSGTGKTRNADAGPGLTLYASRSDLSDSWTYTDPDPSPGGLGNTTGNW